MQARRVDQLDELWRVGYLDHLFDLLSQVSRTGDVAENGVSVVVVSVKIVVVGRLAQELICALVGKQAQVAKTTLLVDAVERAEHDQRAQAVFRATLKLALDFADFELFDLDYPVALLDSVPETLLERVWRND